MAIMIVVFFDMLFVIFVAGDKLKARFYTCLNKFNNELKDKDCMFMHLVTSML